jgi:hypothetical protein
VIKPGFAEAHNNRGSVLAALGRDAEALLSYDRALAMKRSVNLEIRAADAIMIAGALHGAIDCSELG